MPVRPVTRHRLGLASLLVGLAGETAIALPFLATGTAWQEGPLAVILHVASAICTGTGAATVLTPGRNPRQVLGLATLFILLASSIPLAGTIVVLALTTILLAHRSHRPLPRPDLLGIPEPDPATDPPPMQEPLVAVVHQLDAAALHQAVLGLADMPAGLTRPLLNRLRRHPDPRVRLHAAGLLNDQVDHAEQRLAALGEECRNAPRDLPTLLAMVELHLQVIDDRLVPRELVPQTAQHGIHAAEAVLAIDPDNPEALSALARFQMMTPDFHGAYGTILRLHQVAGQKTAAADLLARLSFEYAARQPVVSTPPPFPPHPKMQARLS